MQKFISRALGIGTSLLIFLPTLVLAEQTKKPPCNTPKECMKIVDAAKAQIQNTAPGSIFSQFSNSKNGAPIVIPKE